MFEHTDVHRYRCVNGSLPCPYLTLHSHCIMIIHRMMTMIGRAMSPLIKTGSARDGCEIQHTVVFEVCAAVVFIVSCQSESDVIYNVFLPS